MTRSIVRTALSMAVIVAAALSARAAAADTLVAIRPGLICTSADALGALTLPDGSSRTARAPARANDLATKQAGGCVDIPPGLRVILLTARRNTSLVTYGTTGAPYIVPNIDFRREPDGAAASTLSSNPAARFVQALNARCPQQGWDGHKLAQVEQGPIDRLYSTMTPQQQQQAQQAGDAACKDVAGVECPSDATIGVMVTAGLMDRMVTAVCREKAPPD